MRKLLIIALALLMLPALTGCRLSINRLNKRIAKWESMKGKAPAGQKVRFAFESLRYFLTTDDFQRSKETLVTEAERLQYHQKMSDMQVFLMDYYAGEALAALTPGSEDWEKATLAWSRADSLTEGLLPQIAQGQYKMVLIQFGYPEYLKRISSDGNNYGRMERQFPGFMEALRKMSRYQYRLAEKQFAAGLWDEALTHYLLVFKRDPENFASADRRVVYLTGKNIQEFYTDQFQWAQAVNGYNLMRQELFGMADTKVQGARKQFGELAEAEVPKIMQTMAERFNCKPEQALDLYLMTKNDVEGTLPGYLSLVRYQVLEGYKPIQPRNMARD